MGFRNIQEKLEKIINIVLFGRNPNRPYDVRQLFGGAGSQLDRPKHWDSYEMESQKFLQIGE